MVRLRTGKYRSHVCLFLSQDRADRTFAVKELCQRMSDPSQLFQIEATCSVPEGTKTMGPSFRIREREFGSDGLLGLRWGWRQRKAEVVKCAGRTRGRHFLKAYTRTQNIIARSSAGTELYTAALGASEAQAVQSMMWDLDFSVKPVLIIDAEATEHSLHRHGIGKMKHIDVAHLWLQDEVKSNKLRVRQCADWFALDGSRR